MIAKRGLDSLWNSWVLCLGPMHCDYTIEVQEVEIGQLELRYAHTRIQVPEAIAHLVVSLERFGQITPVTCVSESTPPLVLVDGYRRVAALKRLGRDMVCAQIWYCKLERGVVEVMARNQERRWEALEQAALIQELQRSWGLTQARVAELLGRDKSWVARRLALIETLPEDILGLVRQGHISPWAATRVLVPLSRANTDHARGLCESMQREHMSTRHLYAFWRHYQRAHRKTRERMIQHPVLFIRTLEAREEEREAGAVREGPEGRWLREIKRLAQVLYRLRQDVRCVIYPGQSQADRLTIVKAVDELKDALYKMDFSVREEIGDDYPTDTGGDHHDVRKGDKDSSDKPDTQGIPEHSPPGVERWDAHKLSYLPAPPGDIPPGQGAIGTLPG